MLLDCSNAVADTVQISALMTARHAEATSVVAQDEMNQGVWVEAGTAGEKLPLETPQKLANLVSQQCHSPAGAKTV
jgi:hypothetical protein